MRNRVLLAFALVVFAGCTAELTNDVVEVLPVRDVFTATIENLDTKVFVDGDLKTHWNEGDEISIFTTTYNQHFKFDGQTGDNEGTFTELSNQFFTGGEVPTVYAVYPYNENTSVTSEGVITLNLPAVQNYAENSFGLGANTMVAATDNKSSRALKFKSVCGYIVVRLYGDATIKSVTLTGNNGEKISGQATVAPVYGQAPAVVMSESAGTSIILDCGEGVELGKTPEEATAFWFAVPPVTFSQGFTIRVTNTDGYSMEKTTHAERTVVRNVKNPLSALEVPGFPIAPEGNIVFEDANFKTYCVESFDKDGDGEISFQEALFINKIDCRRKEITSLEGIQFFTSLDSLECNYNKLTSLDVSRNTRLKYLICNDNLLSSLDVSYCKELTYFLTNRNQLETINLSGCTCLEKVECDFNQLSQLDVSTNRALKSLLCLGNHLTSLDVSNNTELKTLWCYDNQLTTLDVSNNTELKTLYCYNNQLATLDVSNNTALERLYCDNNQLTSLDVSSNAAMKVLWCYNNPNLNEIWLKTGQTISDFQYDTDVATIKYRGVDDVVAFEDSNFKAYCVENFDTNGDGEISYEEGLTVTRIEVNTDSIESLVGIEHFLNLEYLCCRGAQVYNNETQSFTNTGKLSSLDVSKNSKLWYLDCCFNQISCLDITNNLSLSYLLCACNRLTAIDVTKNNQLYYLALEENPLNELDVHNNPSLYHLTLLDNPISSIDLSNNKNLYEMAIGRTLINSIDISNNNKLDYFECVGNTQLESIVIGTQPCLKTLFLTGSKVSSINISGCVELTELIFTYNTEITELNLDKNKRLKKVTCTNNSLSFINIRGNTSLEEVIVYKNHLTSFDAHNCSSLSFLNCQYNSIKSINVDGCSSLLDLRCDNNQLTTLDVSSNTALTYLDCRSNQLTSLDVSNNAALTNLYCNYNPYLTEICLKAGQTISYFSYDTDVATIKYKADDKVLVSLSVAGTLSDKLAGFDCLGIKELILSGEMDARDFNFIKWECRNIEVVDLSQVSIVEYSGEYGTNEEYQATYPANEIPLGAFFYWMSNYHRDFPAELTDEGMPSLRRVVLPAGIKAIRRNAFARAYHLSDINFPEGLEQIDYVSFNWDFSLKRLDFPSSLKSIGLMAFNNCNDLAEVHCKASTPPSLNYSWSWVEEGDSVRGWLSEAQREKRVTPVLYVPTNSLSLYQESNWALFFTDIRGE